MLRLPAPLENALRLIGSGFGFGARLIAARDLSTRNLSSSAISRPPEAPGGADQAKRTL